MRRVKRVQIRRQNIKAILSDRESRKELMVRTIITMQAREGIITTRKQAECAYDKVVGDIKGE